MGKGHKQLNIGRVCFFHRLDEQIAYIKTLKRYVVDCKPVHGIAWKVTWKPGCKFHKFRENPTNPKFWDIIIHKTIN